MKFVFKIIFPFLFLWICFAIHSYVVKQIDYRAFYSLSDIYVFHTLCLLSILLGLFIVSRKWEKYIGMAFLVLTGLQFIACLGFIFQLFFIFLPKKIFYESNTFLQISRYGKRFYND